MARCLAADLLTDNAGHQVLVGEVALGNDRFQQTAVKRYDLTPSPSPSSSPSATPSPAAPLTSAAPAAGTQIAAPA